MNARGWVDDSQDAHDRIEFRIFNLIELGMIDCLESRQIKYLVTDVTVKINISAWRSRQIKWSNLSYPFSQRMKASQTMLKYAITKTTFRETGISKTSSAREAHAGNASSEVSVLPQAPTDFGETRWAFWFLEVRPPKAARPRQTHSRDWDGLRDRWEYSKSSSIRDVIIVTDSCDQNHYNEVQVGNLVFTIDELAVSWKKTEKILLNDTLVPQVKTSAADEMEELQVQPEDNVPADLKSELRAIINNKISRISTQPTTPGLSAHKPFQISVQGGFFW